MKKEKQVKRIRKMSKKLPTKVLWIGRNRIKTKNDPSSADLIALNVIEDELKKRGEL